MRTFRYTKSFCRVLRADIDPSSTLCRAPVQITAEQLLREAQERQEAPLQAPRQRVEDYEELSEFRGRKRKEFEEVIRRTRRYGQICIKTSKNGC